MQRPFLPAAIVFLLVWGCAPALVENPASAPLSTDAPSAIATHPAFDQLSVT